MNQKVGHDSKHHDTDRTSVVITRRVRSGCEAAYEALLHGLLEERKGFSGCTSRTGKPKNVGPGLRSDAGGSMA